jgi:hypothetical protein
MWEYSAYVLPLNHDALTNKINEIVAGSEWRLCALSERGLHFLGIFERRIIPPSEQPIPQKDWLPPVSVAKIESRIREE